MAFNVLSIFGFSPQTQDAATSWLASKAKLALTYEKKEVTLEKHPLQIFFRHLIRNERPDDLSQKFAIIPFTLRDAIVQERGRDGNLLDDFPRLAAAIATVVSRVFDRQPQEIKNGIYGAIYRMARQPVTQDFLWGEHHVKDDTERLIRALHRHQLLEIRGKEITLYAALEKDVPTPSCIFHLDRRELPYGQIGLHNGMRSPLDEAKRNAYRISDDCVQGYNMHCTYSATVSEHWDNLSAVLSQGGDIMPPVIQLLEQWQDFAEANERHRLLQLCTSRGAIEVYNALCLAPRELQQKIIVIAIAPACIIPAEKAYKAVNLVIPEDAVVQFASNRHLIDQPYVWKLPPHDQSGNHHDLHGISYRRELIPMIDRYIRTNDI